MDTTHKYSTSCIIAEENIEQKIHFTSGNARHPFMQLFEMKSKHTLYLTLTLGTTLVVGPVDGPIGLS